MKVKNRHIQCQWSRIAPFRPISRSPPSQMNELMRQVETLRDVTLGDHSSVDDEHRYELRRCLDQLMLPPQPNAAPSPYLDLCWALRGKMAEKELLRVTATTFLRLAVKFLSDQEEVEQALEHWKARKSLEEEQLQRQMAAKELPVESPAAQLESRSRGWAQFTNPLPWRRR